MYLLIFKEFPKLLKYQPEQSKFDFRGLLNYANKTTPGLDYHKVSKRPVISQNPNKSFHPSEKGSQTTPKYQDNFTFEDLCIETPGFLGLPAPEDSRDPEDLQFSKSPSSEVQDAHTLKYGPYQDLVQLYESEKMARRQFEQLYTKGLEELANYNKSGEGLAKDISEIKKVLQEKQETIDEMGRVNKAKVDNQQILLREIDELNQQIAQLKEGNKVCKRCPVYINEIKSLRERAESTKAKNLNEVEKMKNSGGPCENCESLKNQVETITQELTQLKSQAQPTKKPNIFIAPSQPQCPECTRILQEKSRISESLTKKIKQLVSEIQGLKNESSLKEIESSEPCSTCEILRQEVLQLQKRLSFFKSRNFELVSELKQRKRKYEEKETQSSMVRQATKISNNCLEEMEKNKLLEQYHCLKKEYENISTQILSQADEMFEKKKEINELRKQKTELYKELVSAQAYLTELNELKEHVAYLLNFIHDMKEKIVKIGELYKESIQKNNKNEESDDFRVSISMISEIIQSNILTIADKKKKNMNWSDEKGKANLVSYLKYSLLGYFSED